jgi:tetratricopeptide (TPR) repeat protein
MYKLRFDQWGLQKNLRSKQVAELLRQKTNRDSVGKSTSLYVRGKRIPEEKLRIYVHRTSSKNRNQTNAAVSRILGVYAAPQDASSMISCRTPSPTPPIPSHVQFTSSNSNPVFESTDVDCMLWFEMEPSPFSMTSSSWLFNTGEPRQISQDFSSVLNDDQVPTMMASRLGAFSTPDTDKSMDWSGMQPSPLSTSSSWISTLGEYWHASQECPVVWDNDQTTPTTASQLGALSTLQAGKSMISCRRISGPSISHLLPLATPQALATPEECMYLLRNYVSGNFDSGLWRKDNFTIGQNQVTYWRNQIFIAMEMLDCNRINQGFRLFGNAFHHYKNLLSPLSFKLLFDTFHIIIRLSRNFPGLAKAIIKHAGELSQIVHQSGHPFGILMGKLHDMDMMQISQWSSSVLDCYSECLVTRWGSTGGFMINIARSRSGTMSRLVFSRLLDMSVAEEYMQRALAMFQSERHFDFARIQYLDIKKDLASLYILNGRYQEAHALFLEALQLAESYRDLLDLEVMEDCYRQIFYISYCEGEREGTLTALSQWNTFSHAEFGRYHPRTIEALADREAYLREAGRDISWTEHFKT